MKNYDLGIQESKINANGIRIIDAQNEADINFLRSLTPVKNLITSSGGINGGEPYGTGNRVIKKYIKSDEIDILTRGNKVINACKKMTPIIKLGQKQKGIILCEKYNGENYFLKYTITENGLECETSRYCELQGLDLNFTKIILRIVTEETKKHTR